MLVYIVIPKIFTWIFIRDSLKKNRQKIRFVRGLGGVRGANKMAATGFNGAYGQGWIGSSQTVFFVRNDVGKE